MKIGVFGSSSNEMKETVRANARRLGAEIAKRGHTLVTGACSGIPHEVVMGAYNSGGRVIGYSPAADLQDHVMKFNYPAEGYTQMVFVPPTFGHRNKPPLSTKYRSINAISDCDIVIIVGGGVGTLVEFAIALDADKPIGILDGSGGITDRTIDTFLKDANRSGAKIHKNPDSVELLRKLIEVDEQDKHITF